MSAIKSAHEHAMRLTKGFVLMQSLALDAILALRLAGGRSSDVTRADAEAQADALAARLDAIVAEVMEEAK